MKVIARLTSPLIAISLAVLPLPAAAAQPEADAPAEPAVDGAPADGAEAAPVDGAAPEDAPTEGVEGVEGAPTDTPPEGDGTEPAEDSPDEATPGDTPPEGEDPGGEQPPEGEVPTEATVTDLPDEDEMAEPKLAGRPAKGVGMMISGGILLGVGAAGIGTAFALTNCPEPSNSIGCKNQHNRRLLIPLAGSVALVGALLLVVGGIHAARYKKWQTKNKNKVAIAPTYLPGGGGVAYSMQF